MSADAGIVQPVQPVQTAQVQQQQPSSAPIQYELMLVPPLVIVFLVALVRAFPWHPWLMEHKPLACSACMVFWMTLGLFPLSIWLLGQPWSWVAFHLAPAPGAALFLLALLERWSVTAVELTPPGEGTKTKKG